MAYGLKILNSSTGSVQIDDTYKNLVLASKGTVTTVNQGIYSWVYADVSYTSANNPILATSCSTLGTCIWGISKVGNTYTWRITTAGATTVDWYIFDEPPTTPPNTGYGIKVFNSSGAVVYTNSLLNLNVAAARYSSNYTTSMPANFSGTGKYAVISGLFTGRIFAYTDFTSGTMQDLYGLDWRWVPGTGVTFGEHLIQSSNTGSYNRLMGNTSLLIADVTNY